MIEIEQMIAIAKESIQDAKYDRQRFSVNAIQVVNGDDDSDDDVWKPPVEEGTFCDYTFEAKPFGSFPIVKDSPPRIGDDDHQIL